MKGRANPVIRKEKAIKDQSYLMALDAYWRCDYELAKAVVATRISHDIDYELEFALYRLWIEVLVKQDDKPSLRSLQDHFQGLARLDSDISDIYYALNLLVYIELDEIELADLIVRTMKDSRPNVYLNECLLILEHRRNETLDKRRLSNICRHFYDYIQLERAIGFAYFYAHTKLCNIIKSTIGRCYNKSPIPSMLDFLVNLDQGKLSLAHEIAIDLYKKYPSNSQFQTNAAASSYINHDFSRAVTLLEASIGGNATSDMLAIYTRSLFQLEAAHEKSLDRLQLANVAEKKVAFCQKEVSVPKYSSKDIEYLEDTSLPNSDAFKQKYWLIELRQREFHDIRSNPENLKMIRKPLGSSVKKGDVCILVCRDVALSDSNGGNLHRLCAIYSAKADPQWHPMHKYETILVKEFQPAVAIPLSISGLESASSRNDFPIGDMRRYGVSEINDEEIGKIEEQVSEFIDDYDVYPTSIMPFHNAQ